MNLYLLNDKEILKELGKRYESIRLEKGLSNEDVAKKGGTTTDAIYRFKSGKGISMINFIRIMRGLDNLDKLEKLLQEVEFSVRDLKPIVKPKRIFKTKKTGSKDFKWGDEK
jgi:predicted transcriptional regulator